MKALICEMCGGKDLVKQDGLYVCQNCGCKYSTEEARNSFEITVKTEAGNVSSYERLLERGCTFLKLEDYKAARNTFKEFINTYPHKRIGYEKYFTALSENFSEYFVYDLSNSDTKAEVNNIVEKLVKIDDGRDTYEAKNFLKKIKDYLNWIKLKEQLHKKKDELNEMQKWNSQLSHQIYVNESNTKYLVAAAIIFFVFGFIVSGVAFIAVLSFIFGLLMFVTIAISNNENKNASQRIDDNSIDFLGN